MKRIGSTLYPGNLSAMGILGFAKIIMKQSITAEFMVIVFFLFITPIDSTGQPIMVDRVLVLKADRMMYLLKGSEVLRSYKISLGKNPLGHKQYEGDSKTPEGRYMLDWRNPNSRYFRSIHISYPNVDDKNKARAMGLSAGGDIMIHGLPNVIDRLVYRIKGKDWTDGCIALDNKDMSEVWRLVTGNTPIDILP